MSDLTIFGLGVAVIAGVWVWDRYTPLSIPSLAARKGAMNIANAASTGCTQIPAGLIQDFQVAMNPWLAGAFPALRTDGLLDTDTANWVDDVNRFYNGVHTHFLCPGVA